MYGFSNIYLSALCVGLILFQNSIYSQISFHQDPSVLKDPTGYKLRYGDRIRLSVRGEPDCSTEATIQSDGKIELIYIGDLFVVGKNVKQAEKFVQDTYVEKKIFANPNVRISIVDYVDRVVFLTGSVNKKGPYVFPPEVEAMNIVEVISRAGGFSDIARKSRVYVTRTFFDQSGKSSGTKTYEIDVESLSSGSSASQANRFWIYPGDRIEVPERLL